MPGIIRPDSLVIPAAGQVSASVPANALNTAARITITAPAVLTGTVKVAVSANGTTWTIWTEGGRDIEVPANRAITIDGVACVGLRLESSAPEDAERVFQIAIFDPWA